jgi:hypothetical protein
MFINSESYQIGTDTLQHNMKDRRTYLVMGLVPKVSDASYVSATKYNSTDANSFSEDCHTTVIVQLYC